MKNKMLINFMLFEWIIIFSSVSTATTGKYAYYLSTTVGFEFQHYSIANLKELNNEIESIIYWKIEKSARDFDVLLDGIICNIRSNNRSCDLTGILYAPDSQTQEMIILLNRISGNLMDMNLTNTNVYYLYHAVHDMIINDQKYETDFSNPSSLFYTKFQNILTSNISNILNEFGAILLEVPVSTLYRCSIKFINESGKLRVFLKFYFYSSYNIPNWYNARNFLMKISGHNNSIIYQSHWIRMSTYFSQGTLKYEFYITGTIMIDLKTHLESRDIITMCWGVFRNISNSLMNSGVLFSGEILNIRNGTLTVDFHGSLLTERMRLLEIEYIVLNGIGSYPGIIIDNVDTFNMYSASIYAFLDESLYNSTYLSGNYKQLKRTIKKNLLTNLLKEDLLLMVNYYYNFRLELWPYDDKISLFSYFLIHSKNSDLFEIRKKIIKVFKLIPSTVDPFNTYINRNQRVTTEHYTSINITFPFHNFSRLSSSTPKTNTINSVIITSTTNQNFTLTDEKKSEEILTSPSRNIQNILTNSSSAVPYTPYETASLRTTITQKPSITELDINLKLSYSNPFIDAYNDSNSEEYKNFTEAIMNDFINGFSRNSILKLLSIHIKSLRPGSVIADMDVVTVSTVLISSSMMKDSVINIAKSSHANITVLSAEIIRATFENTTEKAAKSTGTKLDDWKIALIAIFSIIGLGILIFSIIWCRSSNPKRNLLIPNY